MGLMQVTDKRSEQKKTKLCHRHSGITEKSKEEPSVPPSFKATESVNEQMDTYTDMHILS